MQQQGRFNNRRHAARKRFRAGASLDDRRGRGLDERTGRATP
jgi:hypothetical protein